MRSRHSLLHILVSGTVALGAAAGLARAQEPGVDAAAPRFAVSLVGDQFVDSRGFMPATLNVEQGDWVRWKSVATLTSHTTTSGTGCLTGGTLWNFPLDPGTQFTRQFNEPPSPFPLPFFCQPHCRLGMKGNVFVTSAIVVSAADSQGSLNMQWQGGNGVYRVYRSDNPSFCVMGAAYPACTAATAVDLTAATDGTAETSLTDSTAAGPQQVLYYLVINKS